MIRQLFILFGLIGLVGACKQEDPGPLKPTSFSIQVIYQQTGLPVDSASIGISGTKGTYLSGREITIFQQGYTDQQGRFQASMLIPREFYTTFTVGKLVKIGNHYKTYYVVSRQPSTDVLKLEQENSIVAQLDTLK